MGCKELGRVVGKDEEGCGEGIGTAVDAVHNSGPVPSVTLNTVKFSGGTCNKNRSVLSDQ